MVSDPETIPGCPHIARASANPYMLAQTFWANGPAPVAYFEHLYEHLPLATTAAELEALLSWNMKALLKAAARSNELISGVPAARWVVSRRPIHQRMEET